jgi:uncharacterized membrane protein
MSVYATIVIFLTITLAYGKQNLKRVSLLTLLCVILCNFKDETSVISSVVTDKILKLSA